MRLLGFLVKLFVSREISRISQKPFVSRETSRLSQNLSVFSWLMAGHLTRRETSRFSRETFRFSWNLSSFAETFRFSQSFSFSQKPFVSRKVPSVFLPWLMAGHPLPINSQDHSSKRLTFFLRENPKNSREEKTKSWPDFWSRKFRKKKREAERKEKRIVLFLISVPNPVTSSVEIRTGI